MKKYLIITVLSLMGVFNAAYLTNSFYAQTTSFCDLSGTVSCTSALNIPELIFFGLPFSAIALAVYPILFFIALVSFWKKIKKGFYLLWGMSIGGILFNSYIILHEIKEGTFCLLCAICSVIIVIIFILSSIEIRKIRIEE